MRSAEDTLRPPTKVWNLKVKSKSESMNQNGVESEMFSTEDTLHCLMPVFLKSNMKR